MSAAMKGGNNDEHHNHNDLGSYVVAVAGSSMLLDPGGEVYTSRTFSAKRYDSKAINSFGHPVPVVAGKLQSTGAKARAVIAGREFTEENDSIVFDITSAYDVKSLNKLTRSFAYSRSGTGSLTVKDEVSFSSPESFGTALISYGTFIKSDDGMSGVVSNGKDSVRIEVSASGPVEIGTEIIEEEMMFKKKPLRIGIKLREPVAQGSITVKISPAR